jgi:SAM-dependent methyltransferase
MLEQAQRKMNDLVKYFEANTGFAVHKWMHYLDIYDRHFSRFRGQSPVVLEIGVNSGGSLCMWRDYFGPSARIIGIDINPACLDLNKEGFEVILGDQADLQFWADFKTWFPRLDILIDDGGHEFHQQRVTFEQMFDHVKDDGVFLCEDLHTSYQHWCGGGFRAPGTFVEYSKGLIDELNAHWSEDSELRPTRLTKSAKSIHFYDSILVIEKGLVEPPYDRVTGQGAEDFKPYLERGGLPTLTELMSAPRAGSTVAAGDKKSGPAVAGAQPSAVEAAQAAPDEAVQPTPAEATEPAPAEGDQPTTAEAAEAAEAAPADAPQPAPSDAPQPAPEAALPDPRPRPGLARRVLGRLHRIANGF